MRTTRLRNNEDAFLAQLKRPYIRLPAAVFGPGRCVHSRLNRIDQLVEIRAGESIASNQVGYVIYSRPAIFSISSRLLIRIALPAMVQSNSN